MIEDQPETVLVVLADPRRRILKVEQLPDECLVELSTTIIVSIQGLDYSPRARMLKP